MNPNKEKEDTKRLGRTVDLINRTTLELLDLDREDYSPELVDTTAKTLRCLLTEYRFLLSGLSNRQAYASASAPFIGAAEGLIDALEASLEDEPQV